MEHAAFRVVQECLTNAMKHAGREGTAQVDVHWGADDLTIEVRTRPGVLERPAPTGGNGLTGLAERVAAVDGTLEAHPTPEGFRTHARLPLGPPGGPR